MVALLALAGITTAVFRHQEYGVPLLPGEQQTVWQIEARIQFDAEGGATLVRLTLPPDQDGYRVLNETTASSGFGFNISADEAQRRAQWTRREVAGEQTLFYKVELLADAGYVTAPAPPDFFPEPRWIEPYRTAVDQVLEAVMPITADARSLAEQLVNLMGTVPLDQNVSLLLDQFPKATLLADLLASASVPARTVQVLALEDGRRRQELGEFVQVWDGERWMLFDPETGAVTKRAKLLLWQTETPAVLEVEGGRDSRISFSMISQTRSSLALAQEQPDNVNFSLYTLPIAEQSMFKLIMLLPVGALVVVFMRLMVGVRTSGTFMPVLIALAFLQTDLIPGVTSFLLVVAMGLIIRSYLSDLNLLLVARIATLVIVVIAIITVFSVISYRLGLIGGLTITFFPMIILAWTIERMSIIWEEEGPREVVIQGGGSLLVAVLAFMLMDLPVVRHMAFNFPELHLVVLALIMLLGRYTGYRLLELYRFAAFKT